MSAKTIVSIQAKRSFAQKFFAQLFYKKLAGSRGGAPGGRREQAVRDRLAKLFLAAEAALWASFLYRDLFRSGAGTVPLKYAGVVLCFVFSLYALARGGDALTAAALAFTVGADTFLLLLNRWYILGVGLFCVVQGLYLVRIRRANGGRMLWPLRLGLFLAALALLAGLDLLDPLNALSLFYFSNFFCNVLQASRLPGRGGRLFFVGLLLFLCCDVCVGMFNQPGLVPAGLCAFAGVGMWLFYLPGQVLIALSALPGSPLRGVSDENQ